MDFNELKQLIQGSREIFLARGYEKKHLKKSKTIAFAFPSVVALDNLEPGNILSKKFFLKDLVVLILELTILKNFTERPLSKN